MLSSLLFALVSVGALSQGTGDNSVVDAVITLTDSNFDRMISNHTQAFLIDIHAPWCSHCRDLEPIWAELARTLRGEINVAKIDATENDGLKQRFFVEGFPTIVLLRDGQTRIYDGVRTAVHMKHWALYGWETTQPVPFYKAPNSRFGRSLGILLGAPSSLMAFITYLQSTFHLSELAITSIFLGLPLLLGAAFIWWLDRIATGSSRRGQQAGIQNVHQE